MYSFLDTTSTVLIRSLTDILAGVYKLLLSRVSAIVPSASSVKNKFIISVKITN